jgi:hypothetical protein
VREQGGLAMEASPLNPLAHASPGHRPDNGYRSVGRTSATPDKHTHKRTHKEHTTQDTEDTNKTQHGRAGGCQCFARAFGCETIRKRRIRLNRFSRDP